MPVGYSPTILNAGRHYPISRADDVGLKPDIFSRQHSRFPAPNLIPKTASPHQRRHNV